MTHTFYIDAIGVNGRQLAKLFSIFYGIHPQIHIVDQTNQCDSKCSMKGLRFSLIDSFMECGTTVWDPY